MTEIVAEISGNHGGSLDKAVYLIQAAARAGCDYVKFQYYQPEEMPDVDFGDNRAMYEKLAVPPSWLPKMFWWAKQEGVGLFASVFSARGVRDLLEHDAPFIKIASMDSSRLSPARLMDIIVAVNFQRDIIYSLNSDMGRPNGMAIPGMAFALVCPLPTEIWETLRRFNPDYHYGFSDHTLGIDTPLRFIRAGAKMVEKHFMLENDPDCVDAAFSADPLTMQNLCKRAHSR